MWQFALYANTALFNDDNDWCVVSRGPRLVNTLHVVVHSNIQIKESFLFHLQLHSTVCLYEFEEAHLPTITSWNLRLNIDPTWMKRADYFAPIVIQPFLCRSTTWSDKRVDVIKWADLLRMWMFFTGKSFSPSHLMVLSSECRPHWWSTGVTHEFRLEWIRQNYWSYVNRLTELSMMKIVIIWIRVFFSNVFILTDSPHGCSVSPEVVRCRLKVFHGPFNVISSKLCEHVDVHVFVEWNCCSC